MSESDSVRDECSSGVRSDGEDEPPPPRRGTISWGDGGGPHNPQHGSSSTLSSCSTTSQARLIQSSNAAAGGPPVPPPRTSSAVAVSDNTPPSDLGKRSTCMQCYLSGHSDGSIDSVEQSTEGSSSAAGTPRDNTGAMTRDRDSGLGHEAGRSSSEGRMRQSDSRDSGIVERDCAQKYPELTVQFKDPIVQYQGQESNDDVQLCKSDVDLSEPGTVHDEEVHSVHGGDVTTDRDSEPLEQSTELSERSFDSESPELKTNSREDVCGEGPPRNITIKITKSEYL